MSSLDEDVSVVEDSSKESNVLRANFVAEAAPAVKTQTSPLLSSTPPTVSKALIRAYPYLLMVNKLLSIITWTTDDYWINIIILSVYALFVLYFEGLVTWFGHLILVGLITLYAVINNRILHKTNLTPTLDEVLQVLTNTCIKADRLLDPIISLSLTSYDIKRLLFTTVFLTPVYLIVTFLLVQPRTILLALGLFVLSYHSTYAKVTRKMIWKIKLTRVLIFYLTGLDFAKARNNSLFAAAFAKIQKNAGHSLNPLSESNRPVRFTYVIYENQRRWLGIGWTSNLLSYERTPWTDEFLNESSSIEEFQLPNSDNHNNYTFGSEQSAQLSINDAKWRWVDKTWRLDLTNDGAITLPSGKKNKTTANPGPDEAFVYYDNVWKRPSTEDSYSKYTRRRRWIRTAELIFNDSATEDDSTKKKKNLRFAEPEPEPEKSSTSSVQVPESENKEDVKEVVNVLDKLDLAPESVVKEVLEPVLSKDVDIEEIKSVNPISDKADAKEKTEDSDDKKNE